MSEIRQLFWKSNFWICVNWYISRWFIKTVRQLKFRSAFETSSSKMGNATVCIIYLVAIVLVLIWDCDKFWLWVTFSCWKTIIALKAKIGSPEQKSTHMIYFVCEELGFTDFFQWRRLLEINWILRCLHWFLLIKIPRYVWRGVLSKMILEFVSVCQPSG